MAQSSFLVFLLSFFFSLIGSEQQCCYDKNDYLMLSYDQQWGSRPRRSHNLGYLPWTEANKVRRVGTYSYQNIKRIKVSLFYCRLQSSALLR